MKKGQGKQIFSHGELKEIHSKERAERKKKREQERELRESRHKHPNHQERVQKPV